MGAPWAAKIVGIREEGTLGMSTAAVALLMGAFLVLVHAKVGTRDSHSRRGIRTSVMCCSSIVHRCKTSLPWKQWLLLGTLAITWHL